MYCIFCGASNRDDLKNCVNCGELLNEDSHSRKFSRLHLMKDPSFLNKIEFLQSLFDLSLGRLISPRIIRFLYGLSILSACLIAVLVAVIGFKISSGFGIAVLLIGAPLIFFLTVIFSRLILEMSLLVFHLSDHLDSMEERQKSKDTLEWRI